MDASVAVKNTTQKINSFIHYLIAYYMINNRKMPQQRFHGNFERKKRRLGRAFSSQIILTDIEVQI